MRLCALLIFIFAVAAPVDAREMERLSRGLVAVHLGEKGVYLSWRLLGTDPSDIAFDVYRDGKKVNPTPLTGATNLLDAKGTSTSRYALRIGGTEEILAEATPWKHPYTDIPLNPPPPFKLPGGEAPAYVANDASVGDLDGDGDYELVLKWQGAAKDSANNGYCSPVILEAMEMDGTSLWRVNLGINVRAGAHYTQFLVFDLDGDGKAEVACRTSDGTIDGTGKALGDAEADHRSDKGRALKAPERLTVFNGLTGAAMHTVAYEPALGSVISWGDGYANRCSRHLATIAFLDGVHPSMVFGRGYYGGRPSGRTALAAWSFRNGKLSMQWKFDTSKQKKSGKWKTKGGLHAYIGQGSHSIAAGDVDGDGKDEILYGAMAIDDDGNPLYSTKFFHGDAHHFSDLDPSRPGLEFFMPHESASQKRIPGMSFRDAGTGEILWAIPIITKHGDIGRGVCADIWAGSPGAEAWTAGASNFESQYRKKLLSCKGEVIGPAPASCNFVIWWDGDLTREILDKNWIAKYNPASEGAMDRLLTADGFTSINGTKANPVISADLLGDWREEEIWASNDGTSLRLYTTTIPTRYRIPTLMHDPIYRLSVAWQNVAYNQPPHTGLALENMVVPEK